MTFRPLIIHNIPARFAAKVDYVVNLSPLLTPNPARPFAQYEWRLPARPLLPIKSDVYPYYPPPAVAVAPPFNQDLWEGAAKALPKATGDIDQSIFVVPAPFVQDDWTRIPSAQKAKVDDLTNLVPLYTVVVPAPPFNQDLWEGAARAWPKVVGEAVGTLSPILTPNPAQPFTQYDWRLAARPLSPLKSDVYSYYQPSVVAVAPPFNQDLWENAARSAQKVKADDVTNLVPLYSVVIPPSRPFYQTIWDNAARAPVKAIGETTAGNAPLLTPNPAQPFTQALWETPARAALKATGEFNNSIFVVTAPFAQSDWRNPVNPRRPVQADTVELLLPLYSPPPPVGVPFNNSTETRSFAFQTVKSDIFVNLLPLQAPTTPFSQNDWPVANFGPWHSDPGLAPPLNPNLYPPPPPPPPSAAGFYMAGLFSAAAVFAHVGHTPVIITGAAPTTPPNGYVAEDGTTFYVAEDGTTFYVQE